MRLYTHSSFSWRRRLHRLLMALSLLALVALTIGLPPQRATVAAFLPEPDRISRKITQSGYRVEIRPPGVSLTSPSPDWTPAERISFSGCVDHGSFGSCFGRTEATIGLYERFPASQSVGRQMNQNPAPSLPGSVFGGLDRQPCIAGGIFQFWPSGRWHYGGRWSRTVSYGSLEYRGSEVILPVSISWSQAGPHMWAFYPDDQCPTTPVYNMTPTPTGLPTATPPGFAPSPTPPGFVPSLTPTLTQLRTIPSQTPTPQTTPTSTPTPCFHAPISPMPLALFVGQSSHINNHGQPFQRIDQYLSRSTGQYFTGSPTQDDVVHWNDWSTLYNQLPEAGLRHRVPANTIVQTTFDFPNTWFKPPGYTVIPNAFSENNLALNRNIMIVLQELGADQRVGGGDDTLLAFMALTDSQTPQETQRMKVAGHIDDVWSPNANVNPYIQGRPSGFQAYLRPSTRADFTVAMFSWVGNTTPPAVSWPQPDGALPGRDWLWSPNDTEGGALNLRFVTEPNKMYRMLAFTKGPVCDVEYGTISQLVFHTLDDADMVIEKSAPAEAVRESTIEYGLVVRNIGTAQAQRVVVTDTLPDGVTFVASTPPPSIINGRTLAWELGDIPPNGAQRISIIVTIAANAPDTLVNGAEVQSSNDPNLTNNRAEVTTSLVRTNVAVTMTATRVVRPGNEFTVTITYRNTSGTTARDVRLTYEQPFGAVLVSSSRPADGSDARGLVWKIGDLGAGQSGTITLRMQALREDEATVLPAAMEHLTVIAARQDADPRDNTARSITALLVFPRPSTDLRLRIYSEFDPRQMVYQTDGATFTWPTGETLFFTPDILLREPPVMSPPAYAARQRIVAWSFTGSGGMNVNSSAATGSSAGTTACKAREQPPASEIQHADLSRMRGCIYRYRERIGPNEILEQGRLYWSQFAPERVHSATYVLTPLPAGPTDIRIQYVVLTELVETGLYDLDGDGRSDSVLDRRTDVIDGAYQVTLLVPRDAR